jgi:hypothetical protein
MTTSRASRPSTFSRVRPVARSQASLKSRIRPSRSYTQTSDWVVSVRILANESPTTNSSVLGNSSMRPREHLGKPRSGQAGARAA